jgi:hypothetical protein
MEKLFAEKETSFMQQTNSERESENQTFLRKSFFQMTRKVKKRVMT